MAESRKVPPSQVRSKTKEKILRTALALFNEEGEANISSVDIASVMEISPGNLYYHYKGKDRIIEELFLDFETEFKQVLNAPICKPLAVEEYWIFFYILFEEIFDFRFFYLNLTVLVQRIPSLKPKFSRLLVFMQKTFEDIFTHLESENYLVFNQGEKEQLAERLTSHFTFQFCFNQLRLQTLDPQIIDIKSMIDEGVYSALTQITPYWNEKGAPFIEGLEIFKRDQN